MTRKFTLLLAVVLCATILMVPGTAFAIDLEVSKVYSLETSSDGFLSKSTTFIDNGVKVSSDVLSAYTNHANKIADAVKKYAGTDALKAIFIMENWASQFEFDDSARDISVADLFSQGKRVHPATRACAYVDIMRKAGFAVSVLANNTEIIAVTYGKQAVCYRVGFLSSVGMGHWGEGYFNLNDKTSQQLFLKAAKEVFDAKVKNQQDFSALGIAGLMEGKDFAVAVAWRNMPVSEYTLTPLTSEQAVIDAGQLVEDKSYASTVVEFHTASSLVNFRSEYKYPPALAKGSKYSEKDLQKRAEAYRNSLGIANATPN